ncbi:AAA domain-containing protein [Nocardiopsis sp. L17-MgMaSL7]|nr:AAA domain-containing protein [Nocardiopsis sp. L17-MgMaSL7]
MPRGKSHEPRNGRLRRYCSGRCRQAAYRARHAPSRQALEESITDGLQELRFLPRLSAAELELIPDEDLAALAQHVGRARAMHEKILAALPAALEEQHAPTSRTPPPMVGAEHQPLPLSPDAPAAAAPVAPVRRADGSFAPTHEQEAIIAAAADGGHLVVEAGAGTGKTSTLVLAAKAMPRRRGLYIAFNRSIAREAQAKMPDNVTASTAHSLAFRAVGRRYKDRLDGPRVPAAKAAVFLGLSQDFIVGEVRLSPAKQAVLSQETVGRFCYSAARDITTEHVPFVKGLTPGERDALARHLVPIARRAWEDLQRTSGNLKFGHDHYLKLWQLSGPSLSADFVLLDEGQDSNPVLVDVIRRQDAQQIVVGDSAQQIYGWRGAEDALVTWPTQQRLQLTQSWRFGPAVANEANVWLAELGMGMRLSGNPGKNSVIGPLGGGPRTVLCRTNATAMGRAMSALADGEKAAIVGGTSSMRRLADAARDLQAGKATSHPELFAFETWQQVRTYVEDQPEEAGELSTFVELIDDHGAEEIITATGRLGNEKGAQTLFSTAHKAKGREWSKVEVADDFREPQPGQKVARADSMLAYVTVTRAMDRLDNTGLAWIHERQGRHVGDRGGWGTASLLDPRHPDWRDPYRLGGGG